MVPAARLGAAVTGVGVLIALAIAAGRRLVDRPIRVRRRPGRRPIDDPASGQMSMAADHIRR
jgi:hypothetical protein